MEDLTDYELVEMLSQVPDVEFGKLSKTNKRIFDISYNSVYSEDVFMRRSEKFISQDIIDLKEKDMKWKEFYIRVYKLLNDTKQLFTYLHQQNLLEIKILANMNPPVYPVTTVEMIYLVHAGFRICQFYASLTPPILLQSKYLRSLLSIPRAPENINSQTDTLKFYASLNPPILPLQEDIDNYAKYYNPPELLPIIAKFNPPILVSYQVLNELHFHNRFDLLKMYASLNPPYTPNQNVLDEIQEEIRKRVQYINQLINLRIIV